MFFGTVTMEDFVKLELPEVTEFDVYLDIDGADEDEEDSTQSGNATAHTLPLYNEKTAVAEVPWQSDLHSPGHIGNNVAPGVLQGETPVASTSAHSPHVDKSDEDEIDIDTPYDGKLMGQTQPKAEITRSSQSLLNRLISFARESNSLPNDDKKSVTAARKSVARKSTTPTFHSSKLMVTKNVAVKSTTPRKPSSETLSNVARKSSTKQSKPATNRTGPVLVKPDSNLLQVKFVLEKSQLKSVPNILSRSGNRVTPGMSAVSVSSRSSTKSHSQTPRKIFTCNEKSGEGIACPECCLVVKQLSLRGHLKNKHNMSMHICKRCRLTFIDVDQYSEHYALHLQEEEDRNAGISSPLQLPPKPSKPFVTRKLPAPAIAREPSLRRPASDIPTVSNEMTSPIQRKLPLKSGKSPSNSSSESLPSDAKGPSSSFSRLSFSSSPSSSGKTFPLQPKLPPKPRKPSASKKKNSSPVTIRRRQSSSPSSLSSESHRARRTSVGSLQSEASSSSDIAEVTRPTSIHYRESQKTAFRRGQKRSVSPVDVQGAKRQRLGKDVLAAVSKRLCNKEVCSEGIVVVFCSSCCFGGRRFMCMIFLFCCVGQDG